MKSNHQTEEESGDSPSALYIGTVVRYDQARRYGFIQVKGFDQDIFFHDSYLQMSGFKKVELGARVSFEVGHNHKGPMAIKIFVEQDDDQTPADSFEENQ